METVPLPYSVAAPFISTLTRALSDFAKLVEVFDRRGVSFVSITQQFNTTTSMGRLTLSVLLSFAQFEREVIGERVRDKIAASKKKGMWMGRMPPLGYDVKDRKLVVNTDEARTVVDIYRRYLVLKSVRNLYDELAGAGIRSKRRVRPDGTTYGGQKIARGALAVHSKPHCVLLRGSLRLHVGCSGLRPNFDPKATLQVCRAMAVAPALCCLRALAAAGGRLRARQCEIWWIKSRSADCASGSAGRWRGRDGRRG